MLLILTEMIKLYVASFNRSAQMQYPIVFRQIERERERERESYGGRKRERDGERERERW